MITLASMGVSSVAYSFVFGWPYAFGIVGTIFVHEAGHALAMRIRGIPFGPAVFIPFIGAFVSAKQPFKSASEMAFVALAGPAVGLVGAACASLYGIHTGNMVSCAREVFVCGRGCALTCSRRAAARDSLGQLWILYQLDQFASAGGKTRARFDSTCECVAYEFRAEL